MSGIPWATSILSVGTAWNSIFFYDKKRLYFFSYCIFIMKEITDIERTCTNSRKMDIHHYFVWGSNFFGGSVFFGKKKLEFYFFVGPSMNPDFLEVKCTFGRLITWGSQNILHSMHQDPRSYVKNTLFHPSHITVRPRSLNPFQMVSHYTKWVLYVKEIWSILYGKLIYKMGQYFLKRQYCMSEK